jgi:hypothetical protein
LRLLEEFEGIGNAEGLVFRSDLQLLKSKAPIVLSGLVNRRFCIGVSAGYTARVIELSCAAIHLSFLGVDSALRSIPNLRHIGSQFLQREASRGSRLESLLRPLREAGLVPKQIYLSNLMGLFAIVREIRAIVNGHVGYGSIATGLAAPSRARLQAFRALEVDCDAFGFVLINLLRGRPFFDVQTENFSTADRIRAFQLGVLMLSCIETEGTPGATSFGGLTSADRVINFASQPLRLAMAMPEDWDTLVGLDRELKPIGLALAASAPSLAPMSSPWEREDVARHNSMAEGLMGSAEVRRAQSSLARFGFAPKNMPTS